MLSVSFLIPLGLFVQALSETVLIFEQEAPCSRGKPAALWGSCPHSSLSRSTGGPHFEQWLHLQEPSGPAEWAVCGEAKCHFQQPRAVPEKQAQAQKCFRGWSIRIQRHRSQHNTFEAVLAWWEFQDDPGAAEKSVQVAGQPAPISQVSIRAKVGAFQNQTPHGTCGPASCGFHGALLVSCALTASLWGRWARGRDQPGRKWSQGSCLLMFWEGLLCPSRHLSCRWLYLKFPSSPGAAHLSDVAKSSLHSMMNQPPELLVGDTFISLVLFLTLFFHNEPQGISEVIDFFEYSTSPACTWNEQASWL